MEIGFTTCKPRERLIWAKSNGFKHIELDGPVFENLNRKLEINKNDINLSFHAPLELALAIKLPEIRKANIDYYKKLIDFAQEYGSEWITLHLGPYLAYCFSKEQALDSLILSLSELVKYAEEKKIILAIENFRNSRKDPYPYFQLGTDIVEFEKIFSEINSDSLKMCFDIGHANITGNLFDYIKKFKDKIHLIHVHDNFGERDEHLVCGKGNINWKKFAYELNQAGFKGRLIEENEDNPQNILESKKFLDSLFK